MPCTSSGIRKLTAINRTPQAMVYIPQSNVPPGTQRTSNEARMVITPTPPSNQPVYVSGPPSSQICVTNLAGCCLLADPAAMCATAGGFATGWFPGPWDSLSGDYVAVRHNAASPSGTTEIGRVSGSLVRTPGSPMQASTSSRTPSPSRSLGGTRIGA